MSVVVVGGGHAGFQCATSLRQRGHEGRVVLVDDDRAPLPYQRPPLSKASLHPGPDRDERDHQTALDFRPGAFYERNGIEVVKGSVVGLDRARSTVALAAGPPLPYDHVVLATGARARRAGVAGEDLAGVHVVQTSWQARRLAEQMARSPRVVVVGAGFVGLEVAAAARARGLDVTVVQRSARAMGRAVSTVTGAAFLERHRASGTRLLLGTGVAALLGDGDGWVRAVRTDEGEEVPAELVVLAVGVEPATDLAAAAGLTVEDGVVVGPDLASVDDPAVFAIGDCSRFVEAATGRCVRLESVQNATDQARHVAARLTGGTDPYAAVPWFWSDQLGAKLQIAGLATGHDAAVLTGDPAAGFSTYCFAGERLLAVETVDRPREHVAARRLLAAPSRERATLTPETVASPGFSLVGRAPSGAPGRG